MSELRVRIKIGEYEFEAEGPAEPVERRADAFHQMFEPPRPASIVVESPPLLAQGKLLQPEPAVIDVDQPTGAEPERQAAPEPAVPEASSPPLHIEEIMYLRGPILSVSVKTSVADAVLMILLGQRMLRRNENVSGIELMEGLRGSGIHVNRVDTLLTKLAREGSVIAMGEHRRRRYRLSVVGVTRAEQLTRRLTAALPDGRG